MKAIVQKGYGAPEKVLESGDVKVVIDKTYPLSEAANAVAHMLGHHARGKVVITVDSIFESQHNTVT